METLQEEVFLFSEYILKIRLHFAKYLIYSEHVRLLICIVCQKEEKNTRELFVSKQTAWSANACDLSMSILPYGLP